MTGRLDHDAFAREVGVLLSAARWSAADVEQVLAAVARIDLADAGSWLREWTALGGASWSVARNSDPPGSYLHAASYYGAALALIGESDGLVDEAALWERQRECWDRAVEQLGGQQLAIPYEGTSLPGYFFSAGTGRRPVIITDPGGRMVTSQAWVRVGAAARAHGYHWLTFDGPGRQAALRRQGLVLRLDWEAVVSPVVDFVSPRADVDSSRMAIVGLDLGGFGVARALAVERRLAAALLVPGIVDASEAWMNKLPDFARAALVDEDSDLFERELHLASLFEPDVQAQLRASGRCFGADEDTLYDLYRQISGYRLGDELDRIDVSTTICDPLHGNDWAGQAAELARRLGLLATLVQARPVDDVIAQWLDSLF